MGFMAGFAEGFSNSFNAMENRRAAHKQDAFKIAYDSYLRKQGKYDEDAKVDKQQITSAKAIAEEVGAPAESWEHAYKMLKEGSSYEQAAERMARTHFSKVATPAMAEDITKLVPGVADMKAAGLTMDQNNAANTAATDLTQANNNPDILGSVFGSDGIFNKDANERRQMEAAGKGVMNATGIDQAQYDQINAGYKGPEMQGGYQIDGVDPKSANKIGDPSQVKWSEAPLAYDKEGNLIDSVLPLGAGQFLTMGGDTLTKEQIGRIVTRDDEKASTDAGKVFDTSAAPLLKRKTDAMVALRGFQQLSEMGHSNKAVLTQAGQLIPTAIQTGLDNVDAALQQFNTSQDVRQAEASLTGIVTGELKAGGKDAADATAFASLLTPIVFAYARANNGTGTLTAQDFKSAYDSILSSTNPDQFENNLRKIGSRMVDSINLDSKFGQQSNAYGDAVKWKKNVTAYDSMDSLYSDNDKAWMTKADVQPVADPTQPVAPKKTWQASEAVGKIIGVPVGTLVTTDDRGNVVPAK